MCATLFNLKKFRIFSTHCTYILCPIWFSKQRAIASTSGIDHFGNEVAVHLSGFGGLEVECWPLVPKFAGSNKNLQHAFLRRGSKAVGPMS